MTASEAQAFAYNGQLPPPRLYTLADIPSAPRTYAEPQQPVYAPAPPVPAPDSIHTGTIIGPNGQMATYQTCLGNTMILGPGGPSFINGN